GNCPSRDFVHPQVDPCAARSDDALQTRDRSSLRRSRINRAPLHLLSRCTPSGARDGVGRVRSPAPHALAKSIPVFSCFSADSDSSIPGLTISSTHTHLLLPAAHLRPSFCTFASLTPNRGVGGAPVRPKSCIHVQPNATKLPKNSCTNRTLTKKSCTAVQPRALTRTGQSVG